MNTPTPITEQHKRLSTQLYNLAYNEIFNRASSDLPACKLIADSEARAVAELTAERDQLRADCDNETKWAAHYLADAQNAKARAERAEAIVGKLQELHGCSQEMVVHWCEHAANRSLGLDQARSELAAERARLDWLLLDNLTRFDDSISHRTAIDAAMQKGEK